MEGSIWTSVWAPVFDIKHIKKAEGRIDQFIGSIMKKTIENKNPNIVKETSNYIIMLKLGYFHYFCKG